MSIGVDWKQTNMCNGHTYMC